MTGLPLPVTSADPGPTVAGSPDEIPPEVWQLIGHFGLGAGNANVIMQLAWLPVGHGVARSRVDSGRVDKHPLKRLRTTVTYLAIALVGTEGERGYMRSEVNRAHAGVRSEPSDPVPYNAFDPELQLWVAACLYQGSVDVYRRLNGHELPPDRAEVLYRYLTRVGTTLQVPEDAWPADVAAFNAYWEAAVGEIRMDELTRGYLQDIAQLRPLVAPLGRAGAPLRPLLRPIGRFLTLGWLPEPFRVELGLPWSRRAQRLFDLHLGLYAAITRRQPRRLREFPFNVYLADARRRIAAGRPIV